MKKTRIRMVTVRLRLVRSREINPRLLRHPYRIHLLVILSALLLQIVSDAELKYAN